MDYFVVVDAAGGELWRGSTDGGIANLVLPAGARAIAVPRAAFAGVALDLAAIRADLVRRIDEEAEQARGRYLTPGAGQALVYQRKEAEADAFVAGGAAGPLLLAEAAARGVDVAALAAEIRARAAEWAQAAAAIEGRRMGAKAAIAAAAGLAGIAAAALVDWPVPAA